MRNDTKKAVFLSVFLVNESRFRFVFNLVWYQNIKVESYFLLMGKRKKEVDEEVEPSIELPKRIKFYLKPSGSKNPESEKLVDEILRSPALVSKVRRILRSQTRSHKRVSSSSSSSTTRSTSSQSSGSSESSDTDTLEITITNKSIDLEPSKPESVELSNTNPNSVSSFKLLNKSVGKMEVDLKNGEVRLINIEV